MFLSHSRMDRKILMFWILDKEISRVTRANLLSMTTMISSLLMIIRSQIISQSVARNICNISLNYFELLTYDKRKESYFICYCFAIYSKLNIPIDNCN